MHKFQKLEVWQKSVKYSLLVYNTVDKCFPNSEKFGLTSQVKRAVISIPSNIAEGAGRSSTKSFIQFLSIALGSSYELYTQLLIAKELNYLTDAIFEMLCSPLETIQKMIKGLIKRLDETQ